MTIREYRAAPRWKRAAYRLYRNPLFLFGLGSFLLFAFHYRHSSGIQNKAARRSVQYTNLGLIAIAAGMMAWIGWKDYFKILLPLMLVASTAGVWLFYVQHQFEGVYWERDEKWDYLKQAMDGSSYYRLPKVLQWFTGNIGFHHLHHLSHRIPNYNLERCHRENELFRRVKEITLRSSLKSLSFRLWDEDRHKLVGFKSLRRRKVA